MTFYCPLEVLDALSAEVAQGERSNSQVIVDALRATLAWRDGTVTAGW